MPSLHFPRRLAALAAAVAVAGVVPAQASDHPQWTPCPGGPAAQCATIPVPVDWNRPDGASLDLAIAKRPATDQEHKVGMLVYAPAGPGSSGVQTVATDRIFRLAIPPELAARFDIVSFDPRGVHGSHPVLCDSATVGRLPEHEPADQAEFDELLAAQRDVGASCVRRTGPVINHLDSVSQARDLDALRVALGKDRLNVYALSYGTVLAQMYAERFGSHLRTMVLDSTVDHSVDATRSELTGAEAAQRSFGRFVDWCGTSTACALHGKDVRGIVAELHAEADAGTLTDPGAPESTLDRAALAQRILEPLGNAGVAETADRIAALAGQRHGTAERTDATRDEPESTPLPIYLSCADQRNTIDSSAKAERVRAAAERVAPDVRTGWHGPAELCVNPPFAAANPPHRLHVTDAPTIMVTNSRYDDATPVAGARRVADQLGDAVFVTYEGMGHGALTRGRCMRDTVTSYLVDGPSGRDGNTTCPAQPLP